MAVPGAEGTLCRPKGRQAGREPGPEIVPLATVGGEKGADGVNSVSPKIRYTTPDSPSEFPSKKKSWQLFNL